MSNELDDLRKRVIDFEKYEVANSLHMKNLLEKLDKLSEELKHLASITNELKQAAENRKKITGFIFGNWFRIPLIVGALLYLGNWVYDLPSPSQLQEIQQIKEHLMSAKK